MADEHNHFCVCIFVCVFLNLCPGHILLMILSYYSKTCVKQPLSKRLKIGFQDQLSLNAGQKYCRMLPLEHSAILLTLIKLPSFIKIFVLSIFEWPFYTGFTVYETSQVDVP